MRTDQTGTRRAQRPGAQVWLTLAATVTLCLAGLLATAGAAHAAAQTVAVSPSTGLSDGQTVTVSGTGWTPNTGQLMIVQCPAAGASQSTCNISGGQLFQKADGQGHFSVRMTVKATYGSTDCTKVQCQIAVNEGTDPNGGKNAVADISFGHPIDAATTSAASSSSSATPAAGEAATSATQSPSLGVAGVAVTATSEQLPIGANTGSASPSRTSPLTVALAVLAVAMFLGGVLIEVRRTRAARQH